MILLLLLTGIGFRPAYNATVLWESERRFVTKQPASLNPEAVVFPQAQNNAYAQNGMSYNTSALPVKDRRDRSWMWSLPLGGYLGAFSGMLVGGGIGALIGAAYCLGLGLYESDSGISLAVYEPVGIGYNTGLAVGGLIGTPLGIWLMGKYGEHETGSAKWTFLGTYAGGTIGLAAYGLFYSVTGEHSACVCLASCIPTALIGGIIGFNSGLYQQK